MFSDGGVDRQIHVIFGVLDVKYGATTDTETLGFSENCHDLEDIFLNFNDRTKLNNPFLAGTPLGVLRISFYALAIEK